MTAGWQTACHDRAPDQPALAPAGSHDRWLTRGVAGIGLASFLADAGHEVPTALLPSLLTSTLGAPAATAVWQVGALRAGAWAARGLRVPPATRCSPM